MSGFVQQMRISGNGMLVRVSMIAAIGGLLLLTCNGALDGRAAHAHEPAGDA